MCNALWFKTRQVAYVKHNIEARSRKHCCREKAMGITYLECVSVVLVIYRENRTRLLLFSYLACPAVPCFSTLPHKQQDFRKKTFEYEVCVLTFFKILSETFIILRRLQRDIVINIYTSSCKVPIIFARFNRTWLFPTNCLKLVKHKMS
jgi:hypothetical protein